PLGDLEEKVNYIIREKSADSIIKPTFKSDHYQILERGANNLLFSKLKFEDEETKIRSYLSFFTPGKYYRAIAVIDDEVGFQEGQVTHAVPAAFLGFSYKPNNFRLSSTKAVFA